MDHGDIKQVQKNVITIRRSLSALVKWAGLPLSSLHRSSLLDLHKCLKDEFWGLILDWGIVLIWFCGQFYFPLLFFSGGGGVLTLFRFLLSVWLSGVEEMLSRVVCPPVTTEIPLEITPGSEHVQILTLNKHTHTQRCYLFYIFPFSDPWLFRLMMKCDGWFNKDVLSLFWRHSLFFVLLCQSWAGWTSHSLVKG